MESDDDDGDDGDVDVDVDDYNNKESYDNGMFDMMIRILMVVSMVVTMMI
jgi:hypothetical protein